MALARVIATASDVDYSVAGPAEMTCRGWEAARLVAELAEM
jgi:hypothetical protein